MSRGAELEYCGLAALRGPLGFVTGVSRASYREHVEVIGPDGRVRIGRVVGVSGESAVIEIFSGTDGLPLAATRVRFRGAPLEIGVGPELVGRVFDGLGRPRDGLPPPAAVERRAIEGLPINPVRRELPREFLETGLSAIDGLNTLVLGQKLPVFTESGLPHDALAMQIVRQARVPGVGEFAIVFAALGLPRETATELTLQTLTGSARLLRETGEPPEVLRAKVTSPNGTTAAALAQLEEHDLRGAFLAAMRAARDRSVELAWAMQQGPG
jgi:V/A-type H+-transporting ATPase subunit B